MKPTPEQMQRLMVWLDARLSARFDGRPFPPIPPSLESDLRSGADFSEIFAEYGFTPDGLGLLPNFYEIHVNRNMRVGTPPERAI
jgi:hypothetical protein